ncbi:hypothetical protein [Nitrosovibrio sp. Nv17]|uniref:hypothetical protein n=1 Tax=Nitrosovibrio sp. Nv17 TaxID=1855339 RepID=UPI000908C408|nr:hypothetical protein [Nitrosovibrio sp. Nv17]SFW20426.1 hypothetical protein SAMN05216414_105146 [Nitrosovibrio sp. Nv17]
MKREQTTVSPEERRFNRISIGSVVTFLGLGYLLYFTARWVEPPMWALAWIDTLKPTLGALGTAARVSDTPFPAQVVIAYCAFSFLPLMAWTTYWVLLVGESRAILRSRAIREPRWKLIYVGLGYALIVLPICFAGNLYDGTLDKVSIGWRERASLSPGVGSATYLLGGYGTFAITAPVALYCLWIGMTGYPRKNVTSSPIDEQG